MASPVSTSSIPSSPLPPHKLKPGDTFILRGPSIWRDITPPDNYPASTFHSDYPPRPIYRALIGPQGLAQSSAEWEVKVLEIPPPTSSTIAQHVDAEIRKVGSKSSESYAVQLNLSHYSLPSSSFDLKETVVLLGGSRSTYPEIDIGYFHAYRELQGRDLMICYGAYAVNLGGVRVIVTIVEDALSRTATLAGWAKYRLLITGSAQTEPILRLSREDLEMVEFIPSLLRVKIESDFALLRRLLRLEPRFCPLISTGKAALGPSTNKDTIRYILRFAWPSISISFMKFELEASYREYSVSRSYKKVTLNSRSVAIASSVPPLRSTSSTSTSSSLSPITLKPSDTFTIRGPSIYRDITPPADYPLSAPDSSHPARPLIRELVGPNGSAQASTSWEVKVSECFEAEPDLILQTVEGMIRSVSSPKSYPISVFLSYSSLPSVQQQDLLEQIKVTGESYMLSLELIAAHYKWATFHYFKRARKQRKTDRPFDMSQASIELFKVEKFLSVMGSTRRR
ncbi:hypothetical protein JCM3765_004825 [Sporobolomyces pararoseus]